MFQPSRNCFGAGASLGSPGLAPPSTHETRVLICAGVSLRSLEKCPYCGSAYHGGIFWFTTAIFMAIAQGRASSYVSSDMGATSPGRWQLWQLFWRIGNTSL